MRKIGNVANIIYKDFSITFRASEVKDRVYFYKRTIFRVSLFESQRYAVILVERDKDAPLAVPFVSGLKAFYDKRQGRDRN